MILTLALVSAACGGGGSDGSSASDTIASRPTDETLTTTGPTPTDETSTPTEPVTSDEPAAARFVEAHMANGADTSADAPDPNTYTDTFAADAPGLYVVYLLDGDADVDITWSRDGQQLLAKSQHTPGGTWAEYHVTPAPGGFEPGQWEVVLEIAGSGEREVLAFTVTS